VRKVTTGQPPPVVFAGTPAGLYPLTAPAATVDPPQCLVCRAVRARPRVGRKLCTSPTAAQQSPHVTTDGKIHTVAGTGTACTSSTSACGDGGAALEASLNAPSGVWADPIGNLYIADSGNNRIRVSPLPDDLTVAGTGVLCQSPTGPCGDGGTQPRPS